MNWLLVVIIAYLIFAVVYVIDKFLISSVELEPVAYAFYVGILSLFILVLIPFDFGLMPFWHIISSFSSGILFVFGLLFFYKAFQKHEMSKITPVFGAAVPIFTFILAYLFLRERLALDEFIAFILLVIGSVIIMKPDKDSILTIRDSIRGIGNAIFGAFLIAGSYVLSKYVYQYQSFINSFIWIRTGSVLGAFLLLVKSSNRQKIFKEAKVFKIRTVGLIAFNKLFSACGFIILNYAVYLGSVSLVNAFQGIQYFFLLIIAVIFSKKMPHILKEEINRRIITQKIIAILFISVGLAILAIGLI
ncbi:EamA family transporter [Patescibacteria group bacterium]